MEKRNKNIYLWLDYSCRFLFHAWIAWVVTLVMCAVYFLVFHTSLPTPLFYGLIAVITISSLLSTSKRYQNIYIWLDLAYQLLLQFGPAWIIMLLIKWFFNDVLNFPLSKPVLNGIVVAIMLLLFLLVWRNYSRHIHNLFLTLVLVFEVFNIKWSSVIAFEIAQKYFECTDYYRCRNISIYLYFWASCIPLASYITAYTSKKWFFIILVFSVILSVISSYI